MAEAWTWDSARGSYYYWSQEEDCFVYQTGLKLDRNYQEIYESEEEEREEVPEGGHEEQPEDKPRTIPPDAIVGTGSHVASSHESHGYTYATSSAYQQPNAALAYLPQAQANEQVVERNLQTANDTHYSLLTDPSLAQLNGPYASRRLGGTATGTEERLDPRYRVRYPGSQFFKVGKIFKVLWPEIAGDLNRGITVATVDYGAQVALKIRWFAVIREGQNCCSCLPIQTYGRQGVAKQGLIKGQHAIIYTGQEPGPNENENPNEHEVGMLQSIRVKNFKPSERLDKLSRINFAKIYTVEHNVKVYEFGDVHPSWMPLFREHFRAVWALGDQAGGQ